MRGINLALGLDMKTTAAANASTITVSQPYNTMGVAKDLIDAAKPFPTVGAARRAARAIAIKNGRQTFVLVNGERVAEFDAYTGKSA